MNLLSSFTQPHSTPNLYAYDFLLWNIKEVVSVYIFFPVVTNIPNILQNIFCALQRKENHTGFE